MNMIFKLMAFSIVLNFAVGIMFQAVPAFAEQGQTGGLIYDENYADGFTSNMEKEVNPSGVLEDSGNAVYRLLDSINLGFIARFISSVDDYMFGLINMLEGIFAGAMAPSLSSVVFGGLKTIITIGYIIGGFYLWTGRKLNE